ncbi:tyrosine-type recombinase/integrase [Acidobacteriota bacterium]
MKEIKRNTWKLDFTLNGKRYRKTIIGTKKQADQARASIESDAFNKKYRPQTINQNILFTDFAQEFIEKYSKVHKNSWKTDVLHIKSLSKHFQGKTLAEISADEIESYKAMRLKVVSKVTKGNITPSTINRELTCLKTIFNKAIDWGRMDKSPARKIKMLEELTKKDRILSKREADRLCYYSDPLVRSLIILALNTGMKRNEMLNLKWENVNLEKGYISVIDMKSGIHRNIPINERLKILFENFPLKKFNEYVFSNPKTGTRYVDINRNFQKALKKSGIPKVRVHDLRHTFATNLVKNGIDIVTVSKLLGHADIKMTMRYGHSSAENMKKAVDSLITDNILD